MVKLLVAVAGLVVFLVISVGVLAYFVNVAVKGLRGTNRARLTCEACGGTGRYVDAVTGSHRCVRCGGSGQTG